MDVIFEDTAVGGLQSEQVLIPGFDGLQFILCVLSLSLLGERERGTTRHEGGTQGNDRQREEKKREE